MKLYKEYNLSPNPVNTLTFDNVFIYTDIAQGIIFKGKRFGVIHSFTIDKSPVYKYVEKFRGGIKWYMMNTKDFISNTNFKFKKEHDELVSLNGEKLLFAYLLKKFNSI